MANKKIAWYDTAEKPKNKSKSVQCDTYPTVLSLKELENVKITCPYPIRKFSFQIKTLSGTTVLENTHSFEGEGATEILLKEVADLGSFAPYETEEVTHFLTCSVIFPDGEEVSGFRAFKCNLRKGNPTTDLPRYDLLEKLNAIPTAKSGMTEDELRQICVDFMKLQCEFPYKVSQDCYYTVLSQNRHRHLLPNTVYGGIPYVTAGAGSLYRLAEFFDPKTGTLDLSGDIFDNVLTYGNACSGAATMAWSRVVSSAYMGWCRYMTQNNGYLPVGPYRYSKPEVPEFIKKVYSTPEICAENGEQVMFESYALMKPADGIAVHGHVRMNTALPVVVRREDGTIDGEQSYALMTEQVCFTTSPNHIRIAPDGTHYTAQGMVDHQYTFKELFETNYIPFTFAEFQDPSCLKPSFILTPAKERPHLTVISSNYPLSDIFLEANEKRYVYRFEEFFRKEVKLRDIFPKEALVEGAKVSVRLFNGETHEVTLG